MSASGQRRLHLDNGRLAALLAEAYPPVRVRSPLRENLARQLRLAVAGYAERQRAALLLSLGRFLPWFGALAGVAAIVLAVAGLVYVFSAKQNTNPLVPATVLLEVQTGTVSVRSASNAVTTLKQGERANLKQGDTVEAAGDGQALITYFTGQTTEIGARTQLQIVNVASTSNTTQVTARLLEGSTVNQVAQPLTPGSRFEITSPSLTASVHSTEFRMVTLSPTRTYVATDQGQVQVEGDGKTALVHAGEQIVANAGQELKVVAQPVGQATWIVQPGDMLWQIAMRYGVTAQDLVDANPWIWDPDLILPGWKLVIPKK